MTFIVTAGPTREYIDPVRFLSNPSTGRMGFAVARAAQCNGHYVVLVAGPVALKTPPGVERVDVVSARDMLAAVTTALRERASRGPVALVMTAAVADWRPARCAVRKLKKSQMSGVLKLVRNPDILKTLQREFSAGCLSAPHGIVRVGFAAETGAPAAEAARKKKEGAKGGGKSGKGSVKENAKESDAYLSDAGVAEMSGTFLKNKKKMPVPITGPYLVVDEFGTKNVIEGKGNVQINNKGIVLEGSAGAKVRCIFDGKVTAVVNDGNYHFVLVRHGEYISVYSNVANMRVNGGETVKAGDILGDAGKDAKSGTPRIQFQLRKEKQILNPADWLRM